jgi:hypothetical protein
MTRNQRFAELAQEADKRAREALVCYRPFGNQDACHRSKAFEKIIIGGKRAGKSVVAAHEFGALVTGMPIIGVDGIPIPRLHPVSTKTDPLIYWMIGWDLKHIGQTLHKLLFQPGMGGTLRVIQDLEGGPYRIWNRASPEDQARKAQSKLAEPIIPERMIERFVWDSNSSNLFEFVELTNGAKIYAYPSSARNPKQGDAVSGIWVDEDIQFYSHLSEWQDRLTDLNGWFMWSVWPHQQNPAIEELIDRAEEQAGDPEPRIESFRLRMTDNPFIADSNKQNALERMGDAENVARRNDGDLGLDSLMMYEYIPAVHAIEPVRPGEVVATSANPKDYLRIHLNRYGRLPAEWTRYLIIDPSFTRSACHSYVVPPLEHEGIQFENTAILEWELIAKQCKPSALATALRSKMLGITYEAFVMDKAIGRQTRVGMDDTVFQAYAKEFAKQGISSRQTHSGFIPGCNVPSTCFRAVRDLMDSTEHGRPTIYFVRDQCPETIREFTTYRKKRIEMAGEVTMLDEPKNPRKHDCMAALQYFAAFIAPLFTQNRAYIPPLPAGMGGSSAYRYAQKILKKESQREDSFNFVGYVHMGPGEYAQ